MLEERRHRFAVNVQVGAGSHAATRGTVHVDGDGEAVDARAGNCEHAALQVIAASQVDEDVFVGDQPVIIEGTIAVETFVIV